MTTQHNDLHTILNLSVSAGERALERAGERALERAGEFKAAFVLGLSWHQKMFEDLVGCCKDCG
jgi:hypothetical protein